MISRRAPLALTFFAVLLLTTLLYEQLHPFHAHLWTAGVIVVLTTLCAIAVSRPSSDIGRSALVAAFSLLLAHGAIIIDTHDQPRDSELARWLGEQRHSAEVELLVTEGPIFYDHAVGFEAKLLNVDSDESGALTSDRPDVRVFYPTGDLPPCSPLPLPGDRVRGWARLSRFAPAHTPWRTSQRRLMENRGFVAEIHLREALQFDEDRQIPHRLRPTRTLAIHRIDLERRIAGHIEKDALAIATAMITGSRGELTPELREPFDITSTGHILAISGLHFAIIAALVAFALQISLNRFPRLYLFFPRRAIVGLLTLVVLSIYLLGIGAPVSARRAYGMTAMAITALCFSPRRLCPLSALALVAGILLLLRPSIATEVGYQLSICATAGIILFLRFRPDWLRNLNLPGSEVESPWRRRKRHLLTFAGVSLSATLATWPVLVAMTGEVPVAGLWTNLFVVPLVGTLLFPLLVAGAVLSLFWDSGAAILLELSTSGLMALQAVLDNIAYWPGTVIRWGTPTKLELAGFFTASALAVVGGLRFRAIAMALAVGALCCLPSHISHLLAPPQVTVHFIDVGQGDATLLELPDGQTVLIDGGGRPVGSDPGLQRVVPYLRHRGVTRLDAVILTHGDYDHYGGLFATIRPFRPRVFFVGAHEDHRPVDELITEMALHGARIQLVDSEHKMATAGVEVSIHRPEIAHASHNDRSLIVELRFAGAAILLPGDIETRGESWAVENLAGNKALVKTPHHGSNTSSSSEFIESFRPAAAVNSSGRHNRFGHPHPRVVERYHSHDVDFFRTDHNGSIRVTVDADGTLEIHPTVGSAQ